MPGNESFQQAAERICHDWDEALSSDDVEALLAFYARDAILESPAVPLTMGTETGVCRGHDELRPLLERIAARKPPLRTYYRTGFLTDGNRTMIFEYPRHTPDGEQMDFRRGDGDRRRPDPAPLRLLGLARRQGHPRRRLPQVAAPTRPHCAEPPNPGDRAAFRRCTRCGTRPAPARVAPPDRRTRPNHGESNAAPG
jgi:hypothetical protein